MFSDPLGGTYPAEDPDLPPKRLVDFGGPNRGQFTFHAAGLAQGLERLTVAEEVVGSRPIIRPNRVGSRE